MVCMHKEEIIQKLNEISTNLTLIQLCEIEGEITNKIAKLIECENEEIQRLINELDNLTI